MKEKVKNLIKEVGINEVESILNQMKSKGNIKESLKKDFIDMLTGCSLSFYGNDIEYLKDGKILFYYQKNDNCFYIRYNIWLNFETKYGLNYNKMKELLSDILEEVLNYKGVTPGFFINDYLFNWKRC